MTARSRLYLGAIRPTEDWVAHFERNRRASPEIPWEAASLTAAERRAVVRSIREFQLGESSEGRHLRQAAKEYARRVRDPEYAEAIDLFIGEEQSHAALLGRYLDAVGERPAKCSWRDWVFRGLRKRAGIEMAICVLLTAEVIAKVYYRALRDATECRVLRSICERILADEHAHVEFHCERLFLIRCMRRGWGNQLSVLAQRMLLLVTLPAVWTGHRRVFRRAETTCADFWYESVREFHFAEARFKN